MLFNTVEFAIFLALVFGLYWFVFQRKLQAQNLFILTASYVFYGWWDPRFLSLIALSTLVDYFVSARLVHETQLSRKKLLMALSLSFNLGLLATFKYLGFFTSSLTEALSKVGVHADIPTLKLVLPVGISFYTFQTLSYTIDVYRGRTKPARDLISFASFVSFFPQLVAGPIVRASNLLPQFERARQFDSGEARDGLRQILWGLFKKVVIADNCATYVNPAFADYTNQAGSTLALATILFAFQIYGDFSGYSDIAIGVSRLFGFRLKSNFAFPYFSRDIAEFWRRWHISLSTWFRDYVYIPLGGSRGGQAMRLRNTFAIFLLSGLWHGANWTFVFWGLLHACFFLPLLLLKKNRSNLDTVAANSFLPSVMELMQMLTTFFLVSLGWVFFRSPSLGDALEFLRIMTSPSLLSLPLAPSMRLIALLSVFVVAEWCQRTKRHGLQLEEREVSRWVRWPLYISVLLVLIFFGAVNESFIYFQF